jgi:hypothetical protein
MKDVGMLFACGVLKNAKLEHARGVVFRDRTRGGSTRGSTRLAGVRRVVESTRPARGARPGSKTYRWSTHEGGDDPRVRRK